ncbi:Hypothetical protein PACV_422 [Pacmanvirus A23]|uniref:Hypothetical protein n=1 Tax=Pacmanvirus A23 TaxID=1932881 RepID=UPI000A0957B6|nr:Hypothetical protein B9W72_gp418 [Pacmanvirus A23]SIP86135.1 Hypothetical protein PACV_422 [Pacmanvirus A23]
MFKSYEKVRSSDCKCAKCIKDWSKDELKESATGFWFKSNNKKELSKNKKFIITEITNKTRNVTVPKFRYEYEIIDVEMVWMKTGYSDYKWLQFPKYGRKEINDGTMQVTEYLVQAIKIDENCNKNEP